VAQRANLAALYFLGFLAFGAGSDLATMGFMAATI
jgi:hypothetical protein